MPSMGIQLMQELAKDKQQEIDLLGEDWKSKIEQIPLMQAMVKDWQNIIFDKFGKPRVKHLERDTDTLDVSPGDLLHMKEADLANIKFKGATIIQAMDVLTDTPKGAVIHYKAMLMTDENHFLRKMLPSTVKIPVKDPAYTLLECVIEVPRGQLVKESLYALDDILAGEKSDKIANHKRQLRNTGRWASRHIKGLAALVIIPCIIYGISMIVAAISVYYAKLPVPTGPISNSGFNTVDPPSLLFGSTFIASVPNWCVLAFSVILLLVMHRLVIRHIY